jgi:hypothetical protein
MMVEKDVKHDDNAFACIEIIYVFSVHNSYGGYCD